MKEDFTSISACPYCGEILNKFPSRKSQCHSCNNTFYVRTDPRNNKRVIATETGIIQIDQLWALRRENEVLERNLTNFGLRSFEVEKIRNDLKIRFKSEPSINDVAWSAYNQIIAREIKSVYPDFNTLSNVYREMASQLSFEGRNFIELLKNSYKYDLLNKKRGFEKTQSKLFVTIFPPYNMIGACENCRKHYGTRIPIDEAIEKMPLPSMDCTYEKDEKCIGWCRCRYEIDIVYD